MNHSIFYDNLGVVVLLEPPEVDNLNNTILGDIQPFEEDVVPVDAMESTDPTTIGFTFTVSEDKSVKRYGKIFFLLIVDLKKNNPVSNHFRFLSGL